MKRRCQDDTPANRESKRARVNEYAVKRQVRNLIPSVQLLCSLIIAQKRKCEVETKRTLCKPSRKGTDWMYDFSKVSLKKSTLPLKPKIPSGAKVAPRPKVPPSSKMTLSHGLSYNFIS